MTTNTNTTTQEQPLSPDVKLASPTSTDVSSDYSDTVTSGKETRIKNSIRRRDKIVFVLNFLNIILSAALLTRDAKWYAYKSVVLIAVTLAHRTYDFYLKGWHFYMMDFCYLVNWVVVAHVVLFPKNEIVFFAAYSLAMGPIMNALSFFRCTLALHTTEKATSFLIHSTPPIVMFLIHWHDTSNTFISSEIGIQEFGFNTLLKWYGSFFVIYGGWLLVYYLALFKVLRNHITKNKYDTLYDYMMCDPKVSKQLKSRGDKWTEVMFCLIHFKGTIQMTTLAIVFYYSYWLSLIWIVYHLANGLYNGATYYINFHSERYEKSLGLAAMKKKK